MKKTNRNPSRKLVLSSQTLAVLSGFARGADSDQMPAVSTGCSTSLCCNTST